MAGELRIYADDRDIIATKLRLDIAWDQLRRSDIFIAVGQPLGG